MDQKLKLQLERIKDWWEGKSIGGPLIIATIAPKIPQEANRYWPDAQNEPDYEQVVEHQIAWLKEYRFYGEAYPVLSHSYGHRGTPIIMAAYLGGQVSFDQRTVWIEPMVDDWERFEIAFDEDNLWVRRSRRLLETQLAQVDGGTMVMVPDLGDALTCFCLLRGTERLLMDLVEIPEVIERKVDEFTEAWVQAHKYFWNIYRAKLPGDHSTLIWAPDRSYMNQCDFSTMISPVMFRRFVVRELERLKEYLKYMVWHLDGPEEIKHLDALLELPYVQAIQTQPGTNRPGCVSDLWLPQLQKIQQAGRSLFAYAGSPQEAEILLNNLSPQGLFIAGRNCFDSHAHANEFLRSARRPAVNRLPDI